MRAEGPTLTGAAGPDEEGDEELLEVKVYGNDIGKALKILKRQLQKEGLFKEIRVRAHYEKPSAKKKRKQREARKKRMKAQRYTKSQA